ncbi:MAG: hypothetical protein ACQES9_03535 [Myxococcota bacterium]
MIIYFELLKYLFWFSDCLIGAFLVNGTGLLLFMFKGIIFLLGLTGILVLSGKASAQSKERFVLTAGGTSFPLGGNFQARYRYLFNDSFSAATGVSLLGFNSSSQHLAVGYLTSRAIYTIDFLSYIPSVFIGGGGGGGKGTAWTEIDTSWFVEAGIAVDYLYSRKVKLGLSLSASQYYFNREFDQQNFYTQIFVSVRCIWVLGETW